MSRVYIGLGGNTPDSAKHLAHALRLLRIMPQVKFCAVSPIYQTAPVGCPSGQRDYLNCVVALQTNLSPRRLHKYLRSIEKHIQKKPRKRNASRRVDIDYLIHGRAHLKHPRLFLPHPRMHNRDFVLLPLADLVNDGFGL